MSSSLPKHDHVEVRLLARLCGEVFLAVSSTGQLYWVVGEHQCRGGMRFMGGPIHGQVSPAPFHDCGA